MLFRLGYAGRIGECVKVSDYTVNCFVKVLHDYVSVSDTLIRLFCQSFPLVWRKMRCRDDYTLYLCQSIENLTWVLEVK